MVGIQGYTGEDDAKRKAHNKNVRRYCTSTKDGYVMKNWGYQRINGLRGLWSHSRAGGGARTRAADQGGEKAWMRHLAKFAAKAEKEAAEKAAIDGAEAAEAAAHEKAMKNYARLERVKKAKAQKEWAAVEETRFLETETKAKEAKSAKFDRNDVSYMYKKWLIEKRKDPAFVAAEAAGFYLKRETVRVVAVCNEWTEFEEKTRVQRKGTKRGELIDVQSVQVRKVCTKQTIDMIVGFDMTKRPENWGGVLDFTGITSENGVDIKEGAFLGDTSIKEIRFGELPTYQKKTGIRAIREQAFAGTGVKMLEFPRSLSTIESGAFKGCNDLERVLFYATMDYVYVKKKSQDSDEIVEKKEFTNFICVKVDIRGGGTEECRSFILNGNKGYLSRGDVNPKDGIFAACKNLGTNVFVTEWDGESANLDGLPKYEWNQFTHVKINKAPTYCKKRCISLKDYKKKRNWGPEPLSKLMYDKELGCAPGQGGCGCSMM